MMISRFEKWGTIGLVVGILGAGGYGAYCLLTEPSPAATSSPADGRAEDAEAGGSYHAPTSGADWGITVTVLENEKPSEEKQSAPVCPQPIAPLEALLAQEQEFVKTHPWEDVVQRYARVPGGVVVSIRDYGGQNKRDACALALSRFVRATTGPILFDPLRPSYETLHNQIISKGLDVCERSIDLRYREVRFGL